MLSGRKIGSDTFSWIFAVLLCCVFHDAIAAPTLSLGVVNASPGDSVEIPVTFTNDGAAVAIQFDVHYDSTQLTSAAPIAGTALGTHGLASSIISPGIRRVVITPPSDNALLDSGELVNLSFAVQANATTTSRLISISGVVISSATAGNVTPGAVAIGLIGDPADTTSDQDGDGMPDSWEITYGLDPFDAADATVDSNGDGYTNLQEYQRGTDPTAPPGAPSSDLVVSAMTTTPSPAAVGESVTVTATVTNNGTSAASAFQVDFYKNHSGAPPVGQAGDASCQISGLAAGASTTCSGQLSYDATGINVVWVQADTMNAVAETNEANNTDYVGLVIRQPDLWAMSVTTPTTDVTVGQSVTLSAVVENLSTVDEITPFEIDIYKNSSGPTVGQTGEIRCPETSVLAPNETLTCTGTVSYDASGSYSVWAQVDALDAVSETKETNNVQGPHTVTVVPPYTLILSKTGNGTGTVTGGGTYNAGDSVTVSAVADQGSTFSGWSGPNGTECSTGTVVMSTGKSCTATFTLNNPPDLVLSSVTAAPSPAAVGETVTLTATVTNSGTSAADNFEVDLYQSLSGAPDIGQTGDVSCQIATLAPGDSTTCSGQVSYDTTGIYIVWAQADTLGTVPEADRSNNTSHVGLVIRLSNLRIMSLTVPASATVGQPVTLSAVVENVSSVDVYGAFEVDIYQNLATAPGVGQVGDITCSVPSLTPHGEFTCSGTVTYNSAGTDDVWVQVDTLNTVNETDESNNIHGPSTITIN